MSLVTRQDFGRVSVLTLQNPPANGYSHAMHRALDEHVVNLRFDDGIDVIVLRGAGERFFCAGADIGYLTSLTPTQKYAFCLHANETLLRLEHTSKLVIAALNGHCVGGGLEIALACDLRIGRASGEKPNLVGLPEVALGVLPGTGGTQRLTRLLGPARAMQLMVEGQNMPVEEAARIGLVHNVFPAEGWWDHVLDYAASFCAPGKAAGAVGLIKRAVQSGGEMPLESGLTLERELQMRLFSHPDAKEGLSAFLEKRAASFSTGAPATALLSPEEIPAARAASESRSSGQTGQQHREQAGSREPSANAQAAGGSAPPRADGPPVDGARMLAGPIKDEVLNLLPRDIVERHLVIPVRRNGDTLVVVMTNPRNAEALAAIAEETGLHVQAHHADDFDVSAAIVRFYRA